MADQCLMCGLVNDTGSRYRYYEDDDVVAVLDPEPVVIGHTLLIPRAHVDSIEGFGTGDRRAIARVVHWLAPALERALAADETVVEYAFSSDDEVPVEHVHAHLLPLVTDEVHGPFKELVGDPLRPEQVDFEAVREAIDDELAALN